MLDALKALSRVHQQQYAAPAPPTEWDDYVGETENIALPEDGTGLDAASAIGESPVMQGLRRLRGLNTGV